MGNYNSKYFDRKDGSLEEAIRKAVSGQIDEAKIVLDLENDDPQLMKDIKKFGLKVKDLGDSGNKGYNEYEISGPQSKIDAASKKLNLQASYGEKLVGGQKKLDKDKDGDIDGKDFALLRKSKKENYELGTPENTKSKLDATPGQSADDWQQQVDTMQRKNASMREALAKVWGMEEGRNPFADNQLPKKEEKKDKKETKTMTGKPMTKVVVDPEMKETKIGKKNVR